MSRKISLSFWVFLLSLLILVSCFFLAGYFSSKQMDPGYARYLVVAGFGSSVLAFAGIVFGIVVDRERTVLKITGICGNSVIVLTFIGRLIYTFLLKS